MTTKKPQPLINKRTMLGSSIKTVGFYYRDIKSACEFYLRYEGNPKLFIKERPQYKSEQIIQEDKVKDFLKRLNLRPYNEWLFKLAFKDVFGKQKLRELK